MCWSKLGSRALACLGSNPCSEVHYFCNFKKNEGQFLYLGMIISIARVLLNVKGDNHR